LKVQLTDDTAAINLYYYENFIEGDDFSGLSRLDNLWHHIVVIFNGKDNWKILVDKISLVSAKLGNLDDDGNIFIGASKQFGEFFHGSIDDIYMFSRALTEVEIQEINTFSTGLGLAQNYVP